MILTFKGFSIVNEAEVDVFMEFSCFFYDLKDVGNLISGSSAELFSEPAILQTGKQHIARGTQNNAGVAR